MYQLGSTVYVRSGGYGTGYPHRSTMVPKSLRVRRRLHIDETRNQASSRRKTSLVPRQGLIPAPTGAQSPITLSLTAWISLDGAAKRLMLIIICPRLSKHLSTKKIPRTTLCLTTMYIDTPYSHVIYDFFCSYPPKKSFICFHRLKQRLPSPTTLCFRFRHTQIICQTSRAWSMKLLRIMEFPRF